MKKENTQPLWKVLNEQRTQGEWKGRQSRGNNAYEFRVDANGRRVCEMEEAYDLENVKTVRANADYTALAVNNFAAVVEALQGIMDYLEWSESFMVEDADEGNDNAYKAAKEALNRIS